MPRNWNHVPICDLCNLNLATVLYAGSEGAHLCVECAYTHRHAIDLYHNQGQYAGLTIKDFINKLGFRTE